MAVFQLAQASFSNNSKPSTPQSINIDQLTDALLRKELELFQLNTKFFMHTALVSTARQRRMFAYAQTNNCLTEAALIEQMAVRYNLAREKRPKAPANIIFDPDEELPDEPIPANSKAAATSLQRGGKDRGRLAAAGEAQMIGQSVGIVGDIFEQSLNGLNLFKLHAEGLTPGLYRQQVATLHSQIDNLTTQRNSALTFDGIAQTTDRLTGGESILLSDLRDLGLVEYSNFHVGTKRFWFFQNAAYELDLLKNGLGLTGNIIGLTGNHRKLPRWQGSAGIFSVLSGFVVLVTPAVGRVTGNLAGVAARHSVLPELNDVVDKDVHNFYEHRQTLWPDICRRNQNRSI